MLMMSRQKRGPEGTVLISRGRSHSEGVIAQEKHGQSCLVEALKAAMGFPPILTSHLSFIFPHSTNCKF